VARKGARDEDLVAGTEQTLRKIQPKKHNIRLRECQAARAALPGFVPTVGRRNAHPLWDVAVWSYPRLARRSTRHLGSVFHDGTQLEHWRVVIMVWQLRQLDSTSRACCRWPATWCRSAGMLA